MEPTKPTDDTQDPFQDTDLIEIESMTVNQGFIPEGLAFWQRWRHPKPEPA